MTHIHLPAGTVAQLIYHDTGGSISECISKPWPQMARCLRGLLAKRTMSHVHFRKQKRRVSRARRRLKDHPSARLAYLANDPFERTLHSRPQWAPADLQYHDCV